MAKRRNQSARLSVKKSATPPPGSGREDMIDPPIAAEFAPEEMPAGPDQDLEPGEALQPPPMPDAEARASSWLTVELVLWGLVLLIAAAVRFLGLGRFSLSTPEANLALSALNWFKGNAMAATDVSPAAAGLTGFVFTIFGAGDVTARVVEAMAGMVPVLLTFRLRDTLGRWQALAAALLFALSASYLHASRTANGEILALAGMYAALTCGWAFVRARRPLDLYIAAAAAGLALASGQNAYTIVFICLTFGAVMLALRASRALDVPELDAMLAAARGAPQAMRTAAITFVVVFLAVATAGLTNTLGFQGAVNIASGWVAQWALPASQPASYYVELLGSYEALPLIFGLGGLFVYLGRGDRSSLFLAWWVALALTFYTLSPSKQPEAMLVILLPLIWAAGRAIGDLLQGLLRDNSLQNDGVFVLLGLLTCGILGINLASYASDGQTNHLIVVAIAFAMLILLGMLAGGFAVMYRTAGMATLAGTASFGGMGSAQWLVGLNRGVAVLGSVALLGLGALFISQSMNLNFGHADDPHEPMVSAPSTLEAQALAPMLSDLSGRWEGDPFSAQIAADASIGSVLRWYLRDFRSVRYFDSPPASAPEPIVIVPAQGPQPGFVNYAAQKLRWRWVDLAQPESGLPFLRWLLFRGVHDVPESYDIIVYVQMR